MEKIKIGLDFGTHQTKICVQKTPDEGHGVPFYEFFQFSDLAGNKKYFLPSIIQINEDNTLSYGFLDSTREKIEGQKPVFKFEFQKIPTDIRDEACMLFDKYATTKNKSDDCDALLAMLTIRKGYLKKQRKYEQKIAKEKFETELENYNLNRNVFRYFKQASFATLEWNKKYDCDLLSIWYISYVIFLLENVYGQNFSINMGVPTDDSEYNQKKRHAVEILVSAYNLVENVYKNDFTRFLNATIDELAEKTEYKWYNDNLKGEYNINIFPEAYAGLISLTSRRKLSTGMNLTVDIGGGTTDISFFTIKDKYPVIYKYWSIPCGLNYIAKESGFNYEDGNFKNQVREDTIEEFNLRMKKIVGDLVMKLLKQFAENTNIPRSNVINALENRVIVYNGGGSIHSFLTKPVGGFTDVKITNPIIWQDVHVINKEIVSPLCQFLTTAYGLSIGESDEEVKLSMFSSLVEGHQQSHEFGNDNYQEKYIDKDQC